MSKQVEGKERKKIIALSLVVFILSLGTIHCAANLFFRRFIKRKFGPTKASQIFENTYPEKKVKNDLQSHLVSFSKLSDGSRVEKSKSGSGSLFQKNTEKPQATTSSLSDNSSRYEETEESCSIDFSQSDQSLSQSTDGQPTKVKQSLFFQRSKNRNDDSEYSESETDSCFSVIIDKGKEKAYSESFDSDMEDSDEEDFSQIRIKNFNYKYINLRELKQRVSARKRSLEMQEVLDSSLKKWKTNRYNFLRCSSSSFVNPFAEIFKSYPIIFNGEQSTKSILYETKEKKHKRRNTN
ncbi:MAG: hypothetical protein ACSNEK_01785 [Parachlamydiaceae bacterium]